MKTIDITKALELLDDESKPYNYCIKCLFLNSAECNGPAIIKMSASRRVEWFQLLRAYLRSKEPWKWSYAYIAEAADLSEGAVIRFFNDVNYDPRISTAAAIYNIMCPSPGENPCPLKSLQNAQTVYEDKPETLLEMATLRERLDKTYRTLDEIHESYAVEMSTIRDGEQKKIDFLKAEVATKNEQITKFNTLIDKLHEQNDKLINKLMD